ncbi:MAG: uroporphyrinogen-III C-methyltransferase [Gemmataceae bacterium]|nr:uroporphyrinogen-III C-methyltransferase [Gemmataceae bacterium]
MIIEQQTSSEFVCSAGEATELGDEPRVFLVGAGPGSPDLLTVRAVELLQQADLIIYDQLVPERLLAVARPNADRVCVGDLPGRHADKTGPVLDLMIAAARSGRCVVRLKGGDPLIFGRGGEEIAALRQAGIAFEIVPGVTAALAAGAYLEIPLTHRRYASALALITGHECPEKGEGRLNWQALAQFPGTLAIYMGINRLPQIVACLLEHGKSADTPAALVSHVSWATQRRIVCRLGELERVQQRAGIQPPALILIGEAVGQQVDQPWSERRPLFGQSVLVTRPAHQATTMIRRLERWGAVVYHWPALVIRPPADLTPMDTALDELALGQWDWLVFTSANGVHGLLRRAWERGRDLRLFGSVRLAAIGPKTAETLQTYHLRADLVPERQFSSEGLAAALRPCVRGQRVLLARADQGRDVLPQALRDDVQKLKQITVYEQAPGAPPVPAVLDSLRHGAIRWVTLTSSNIARRFLEYCDAAIEQQIRQGKVGLVAISPETANVVRQAGLPVAAEANTFTEEGLLNALVDAVRNQGGSKAQHSDHN